MRIKAIHVYASVIFFLILVFDQFTKYLIRINLTLYRSITVIPGFFDIVYVLNKGGAFGIFSNHSSALRSFIFVSLSIITIIILGVIYIKSQNEAITRLGIAFLISGAVGNLVDRFRWGMVVDFLDFYVGRWHWPAFNVADIAICIGLGLIFLDILKHPQIENKEKV